MANERRNEVDIELIGQVRTMKASFEAIQAIEAATGKSIIALVHTVANGDLSFTTAATVVYHGLLGNSDRRLSMSQVGNALVEMGIGKVGVPVVTFLQSAMNGVAVGKSEETESQ